MSAAGGGDLTARPNAAVVEPPDVDQLTRVVALDGPAGSGKSTVARRTAQALGWRFVDTGATYRAVTLHVLRAGVSLDDAEAVARSARQAHVELDVDAARSRVLLDGEDVSVEIRGSVVTAAVSAVSAVPAVRVQLIELQRELMGLNGAVVEGRDIATVVAPRAALKVYLDASPEVRAQRRAAEGDHPPEVAPAALEREGVALAHRDTLDSKTNPLVPSEGAVHLDTSRLTLDEVVASVVRLARQAGLLDDSGTDPKPDPMPDPKPDLTAGSPAVTPQEDRS